MPDPNVTITKIQPEFKTAVVERPGDQGGKGQKGDPGIVVSATEPADPQENDLWLEIPE